jgi:hypothetical protein
MGQSKLNNQEKQHEDKQNKDTTQYVLDITIRKQTQRSKLRIPVLDKHFEVE